MDDPVIAKFRAALARAYGPRPERAVLFSSRARGDAKPGSDYDIAVFLNGMESRWDEAGVLAENRGRPSGRNGRCSARAALPRRRLAGPGVAADA